MVLLEITVENKVPARIFPLEILSVTVISRGT
jgi:hypothetical protein